MLFCRGEVEKAEKLRSLEAEITAITGLNHRSRGQIPFATKEPVKESYPHIPFSPTAVHFLCENRVNFGLDLRGADRETVDDMVVFKRA